MRRAKLAARIKASFYTSDISEELEMFSQMMQNVYLWQQETRQRQMLDSISNTNPAVREMTSR